MRVKTLLAGAAFMAALAAPALAVTNAAHKVPAWTKIRVVLAKGVDSRTIKVGDDFKLEVDDPNLPALQGAAIVGHVIDVAGPGGLSRARVGFIFDYMLYPNGQREPIHAQVLSKNVSQTNTAAARQEQQKLQLPPMPVGTVTPGPIAFQINFRAGAKPSVTPPPVGASNGYVYAQNSNENIVIPPGTQATIQLTHDLTVP